MLIFETTKEDLNLAKAEIEALAKVEEYENNLFIVNSSAEKIISRFTLINFGYRIICEEEDLISKGKKIIEEIISRQENNNKDTNQNKNNSNNNDDKRIESFKFEGKVNKIILDLLKEKGIKIDLEKPDIVFEMKKVKDKKYLCEKVYTNSKEYLTRDPKFREGFHPGACSSKLARIMVNLSGVKSGKIIDPFCGTGGVLIEASNMGLEAKGYDINFQMIEKAKINKKQFNSKYEAVMGDALEFKEKCDAVVTELPFGKTTIIDRSVSQMLSDFLKNIESITDKAVVGVPDAEYEIKGWKIIFTNTMYIHKSMSKKLFVLEKIEK